jgi:hypothetical protein
MEKFFFFFFIHCASLSLSHSLYITYVLIKTQEKKIAPKSHLIIIFRMIMMIITYENIFDKKKFFLALHENLFLMQFCHSIIFFI